MRKAITAALVSIGVLAGISGSARAQQVNPVGAWLWWMQQGAPQLAGSGIFPPIGQPAVPAGGAALGYWCVVGPANLPYGLRQMATPYPVGSLCYNPQTGPMP